MNKKLSNFIFLAIGLVFIISMSVAMQLIKVGNIVMQVIVVVISFSISYLLNSLIHELGRLLTGKITGFKFISFRVFNSITYKGKDGKTKSSSLKNNSKIVEACMYKENNQTFNGLVLLALGGAIFNLLASVGFIVASEFVYDEIVKGLLLIAGITGFFILVISLIPLNTTHGTEGSYLLYAKKNSENLTLHYAYLEYLNHICIESPTTFDINKLSFSSEFNPENPIQTDAIMTTIQYYVYTHNFKKAYEIVTSLEKVIDRIVDKDMFELKLKKIFLETMTNQDDIAQASRDDMNSELKDVAKMKTLDRAIENYAYYKFSNMDEYASEEAYEQAVKLFEKAPFDGLVEEQRKLLDFLKNYRFIDEN